MGSYREVLRYTKTVDVFLQVDECRVSSLKITGDFFVYPEDALERAEERAIGCSDVKCLENALSLLREAQVVGFDPLDLSSRIVRAFTSICREDSST